MKTVIDCGCEEEVVIAGLLHDVVEDTPVTIRELNNLLGNGSLQLLKEPLNLTT